MIKFEKNNYLYKLYKWLPIVILYISVLNEFDLNYLNIDSFSYIAVCIFASYLRNITIRPNLIKDWFYFLFVISLINSINYSVLFLFFSYELEIMFYVINNFFTFLFFIPFSFIFNYYFKALND